MRILFLEKILHCEINRDWLVVRQFIAVFEAQSIALLQTLFKTNFTV